MIEEAASHLPASTTAPRAARRFVADALEAWSCLKDADAHDRVVLLTCEIVTNALLHARSDVLLRIRRNDEERIRIEVEDGDPSPLEPPAAAVAEDATTGRGLLLVEGLADEWGVEPKGDGKVVWFEVSAA